MNHAEIEQKLMDLDHRVDRIEQILPTLLTRDEFQVAMEKVATKEDLRGAADGLRTEMATKAALEALRTEMATKAALEGLRTEMATKAALEALRTEMATKAELEALRSEMQVAFVNHSSEIRRHFDVVSESLRGDIRLIVEGHSYLLGRLDRLDQRLDAIERQPPRPR